MIKSIRVKLNVDMLSYPKGSTLTLINKKYSSDGVFLNSYFKKRLADSKIDNCLEILSNTDSKDSIQPLVEESKKEDLPPKKKVKIEKPKSDKPKKRGRKKASDLF